MKHKRIIKFFTLSIVTIFLILFLVPSRFLDPSVRGNFNAITGNYTCEEGWDCKHEEGHLQDTLCAPYTWMFWEWCNTDLEFRYLVDEICSYDATVYFRGPKVAILIYRFPGIGNNPRRFILDGWAILQGGQGGYGELYASLYKWKDNDISIMQFLEETLLELQEIHDSE